MWAKFGLVDASAKAQAAGGLAAREADRLD
jgi:hypothetical protein